jgi:hypothetical protein
MMIPLVNTDALIGFLLSILFAGSLRILILGVRLDKNSMVYGLLRTSFNWLVIGSYFRLYVFEMGLNGFLVRIEFFHL